LGTGPTRATKTMNRSVLGGAPKNLAATEKETHGLRNIATEKRGKRSWEENRPRKKNPQNVRIVQWEGRGGKRGGRKNAT